MEDFNPNELINVRDRFKPTLKSSNNIDLIVSEIVGKEIKTTDPRLLKLIVRWKQELNKSQDSKELDNFFDDPKKIEELKTILV